VLSLVVHHNAKYLWCYEGGDKMTKFEPASVNNRRAKLLIWGGEGVGKTTIALQFPNPLVIELDADGSTPYAAKYPFAEPNPKVRSMLDMLNVINMLATTEHNYKTLVIDPITILWRMHQARWNDTYFKCRKPKKDSIKPPAGFKGDFYEFQISDWRPLKQEWYRFVRNLTFLDMNVVATSHLGSKWRGMEVVGETFDCEKTLGHAFSTVLRMDYKQGNSKVRVLTCDRDRWERWQRGDRFEGTETQIYKALEDKLNKVALEKDSKPVSLPEGTA
jgi:GTPase SAR1 family protein